MKGSDLLAWCILFLGIIMACGAVIVFLVGGADGLVFGVCAVSAGAMIAIGVLYLAYGTYIVVRGRDYRETEHSSTLGDYREVVRESNRDEEHGERPKERDARTGGPGKRFGSSPEPLYGRPMARPTDTIYTSAPESAPAECGRPDDGGPRGGSWDDVLRCG